MSTKGTIFLTNNNEHVYHETIDQSIVYEIDVDSIEKMELHKFCDKQEIVSLDKYKYIIIKTCPRVRFLDCVYTHESYKPKENKIYFNFSVVDFIETNISELELDYWWFSIELKKDSEWLKEFRSVALSSIESEIKDNLKKYYLVFGEIIDVKKDMILELESM